MQNDNMNFFPFFWTIQYNTLMVILNSLPMLHPLFFFFFFFFFFFGGGGVAALKCHLFHGTLAAPLMVLYGFDVLFEV